MNCRPLKGCSGPTEATCRRLAMPGRVAGQCDGTRLQQIPITISVLTALGRTEELKSHIRMGLNNGLTRDELKEIFLHVGVYAGVPTAVAAVRAAMEVFAEIDGPKG